jgi:CBS domain-containing protein
MQVESGSPTVTDHDGLEALLGRLRREPALRSWVLSAPTGALATLGVTLDDHDISNLLDQIEAMEEKPVPVTAKDVMTTHPITVQPTLSTHEVAQLLAERHISGMPVCNAEGELVGVVSEYDLIAHSGKTVGDVMTRDVVSVREDMTVEAVRALFVTRRVKRVPVVNSKGHLTGLISRADLVRELAYRWTCSRCSHLVRARHAPQGCSSCGASDSYQPATPDPVVSTCPTCGKPLEEK